MRHRTVQDVNRDERQEVIHEAAATAETREAMQVSHHRTDISVIELRAQHMANKENQSDVTNVTKLVILLEIAGLVVKEQAK